jgi:hypothetical protein
VHARFSLELLADVGALRYDGTPLALAGVVSHLSYLEPANLVLAHLLESGALHAIVDEMARAPNPLALPWAFDGAAAATLHTDTTALQRATDRALLAVLAFVLLRAPPREGCAALRLSDLPPPAAAVLTAYGGHARGLLADYLRAYALEAGGGDGGGGSGDGWLGLGALAPLPSSHVLPRSGLAPVGTSGRGGEAGARVAALALPSLVRCPFAALDGRGEAPELVTVPEALVVGLRAGVSLDAALLPTVDDAAPIAPWAPDMYAHGALHRVCAAHGLEEEDLRRRLEDFSLALRALAVGFARAVQAAAGGDGGGGAEAGVELTGTDSDSDDDYDDVADGSAAGNEVKPAEVQLRDAGMSGGDFIAEFLAAARWPANAGNADMALAVALLGLASRFHKVAEGVNRKTR